MKIARGIVVLGLAACWAAAIPAVAAVEEAAASLERARAHREAGRTRRARRSLRRTSRKYPGTAEAAAAQLELGRLLEERGRTARAAEAYVELLDRYAGRVPHQETLERLFALGSDLLERRVGRFLFFPGFRAPERALPVLEAVVRHGPQTRLAAEAQYLIGRAHREGRQYEEAIRAYNTALYRFTWSPFAEEAAFEKALCLEHLADEAPSSDALAEQAWAAFTFFLNTYPQSRHAPAAADRRQALYERRARAAFDRAVFYDRYTKNPRAAYTSYRIFLRSFPQSAWAPAAERRMQRLSGMIREKEDRHDQSS